MRAEGSVAAEDEVDAGVWIATAGGGGFGQGGEEFEALLGAHVAGVEEDDFCPLQRRRPSSRRKVLGSVSDWGWTASTSTQLGKRMGWSAGTPLVRVSLDHLERDAGDAGEGAGEEEIEAEGQGVDGAFGGQEAEVECGVDFEVLYVEPGGCASGIGDEEGDGRAEEGGLDGEDDVGLPEGLTEHDREAAEHEGVRGAATRLRPVG